MTFRIYPVLLSVSEIPAGRVGTAGSTALIADYMWVLQRSGRTVVVDTGCADPDWSVRHHRALREVRRPGAALRELGVDPAVIDLVINTHLHWDHVYGNGEFPNARFVVQREELRYASAPDPDQEVYYETRVGGLPYFFDWYNRYELVDGDTDLEAGIRLITLPGHTPGLQGVLVETAAGPYLLPADTVPMYANWEPSPSPSGIVWSHEAYRESFDKIRRTGAAVLPCHDPAVAGRRWYG